MTHERGKNGKLLFSILFGNNVSGGWKLFADNMDEAVKIANSKFEMRNATVTLGRGRSERRYLQALRPEDKQNSIGGNGHTVQVKKTTNLYKFYAQVADVGRVIVHASSKAEALRNLEIDYPQNKITYLRYFY